jgi:hypothetical protein
MCSTQKRLREGLLDRTSPPSTPLTTSGTLPTPPTPGSAFAASLQMLLSTTAAASQMTPMPTTPGRVTEEHQRMRDEKAVDAELYAYENEALEDQVTTYLKGGSDLLLTYWAVRRDYRTTLVHC